MKSSRLLGVIGTTVCLALAAAACGSGSTSSEAKDLPAYSPKGDAAWKATVAAAKKERKVTWYTVSPKAASDALVAAFEKKFPSIKVDIRQMGTAEMDAALASEHKTGAEGADVVTSVSYGTIRQRQRAGWFVDLKGPSIKSGWTDPKFIDDDQILSSPLGIIVLGWNTKLFPKGVHSYTDLYNPDLKGGAIGVVPAEPAIQADWWAFVQSNYDKDFLTKLAAQKPTVYASAFAVQEALVAGEIAVGSFVSAADLEELKAKGAPVDYAVPKTAWSAQNQFFIPDSATHKNAAQLFMDFFASPTGQLAAAKNGYSPVASVSDKTLGGKSKIVLTNVDRTVDTKWFDAFSANWKKTFGQ